MGSNWAAIDLEAHTYYKNKKISSQEELENITKNKTYLSDEFFKDFEVKIWCIQIYDEINGFKYFNNLPEFLTYIKDKDISILWDFNLKYDGTALLALGFSLNLFKNPPKKFGGYPKDWYYIKSKLNNSAIYEINGYNEKHKFNIYDFSNIMRTSLKGLSEAFDLPVFKTSMDYFNTDFDNLTDQDREYLRNDVLILYESVKKLNNQIEELNDEKSLLSFKPLKTAGGIAKFFLLREMFPNIPTHKDRLDQYFKYHPGHNTVKFYNYYKDLHLYRGGITTVNPEYCGKVLTDPIYSYDVNSEYPAVMLDACDLVGKPIILKDLKDFMLNLNDYEVITIYESLELYIKSNCFPVFCYDGDYYPKILINEPYALFNFEINKLKEFYDFKNEKIREYHLFKKGDKVYKNYISSWYNVKVKQKDKPVLRSFAKVLLNSSYGKLGQSPVNDNYVFGFKDGVYKFIKAPISEVSEKSAMSIINASYITARARCFILSYIMEIGQNNPRKNIIYMDTDSAYTFKEFEDCDSVKLGKMKFEKKISWAIFLAPKTYLLHTEEKNYFCTKGLNKRDLTFLETLDIKQIPNYFYYDVIHFVTSSELVNGGRLIFKRLKYLKRSKNMGDF